MLKARANFDGRSSRRPTLGSKHPHNARSPGVTPWHKPQSCETGRRAAGLEKAREACTGSQGDCSLARFRGVRRLLTPLLVCVITPRQLITQASRCGVESCGGGRVLVQQLTPQPDLRRGLVAVDGEIPSTGSFYRRAGCRALYDECSAV